MRAEPIAGRYELVDEIKSGGMGQVWRGYDAVLDREVAVKLIRSDVISSAEQAEEFAKRFRREARVTARIQHHGVPQVYDAVLDSTYDRVYLVMEYVRGTPLRAYIDPLRPLPVEWAAAVAAQICAVLSHAHAIPVVHRDLKPDNVLVSDGGAVKVLDFGIAALLRTDVTRLTVTGSVIGTHHYMSPEQLQGAKVSPQSDLYALGCIVHELLVGKTLFDGGSDYELMSRHINEPPLPLRRLRPDVPEALDELVLELAAKVPEHRPRDAYDVYDRLLPFLPAPGTRPPKAGLFLAGMPDPTLLYRRPNAPRSRSEAPPTPDPRNRPIPSQQSASDPSVDLRAEINQAWSDSNDLLAEERYAQAAEALQQVVASAAAVLGVENHRVLGLRQRRAAILFIGENFRQALPEFDALYSAFSRIKGPTSDEALACLRQAAHCRAELGQGTVALRQFRQVLTHVRAAEGDVSRSALELRRDIAMLLLAESRVDQAVAELVPLHEDLTLLYGPNHEETQEIANVLARLRLTGNEPS